MRTHHVARISSLPLSPSQPRQSTHPPLPYIIGNGGALLLGLVFAYVALRSSGAVSLAVSSLKISDFMSYYSALRLIYIGHGSSIYTFSALHHLQVGLMYPLTMPNGFQPYYLYPPYFALILAPLAALPFDAAYLVWTALNCLLLICSLYLLEQYCGLGKRAALALRLASVCFLPVFVTLLQGQVSILLLLLLVLVFFALRRGTRGEILAGVLLACALIKPQYVVPVLLVLALRRQWRLLGSFMATAAVLFGLPMLIFGPSISGGYLRALHAASSWSMHAQYIGFGPEGNQSFAGAAQQLLPALPATIAFATLCLLVLGLLGWVALRAPNQEVALGMAVVVALLISPHVFIYDLALLLLPAVIVLRYRPPAFPLVVVCLMVGYGAIFIGYRLAFSTPIHLAVIAMLAMCVWFWQLGRLHAR